MHKLKIKRVYEQVEESDGFRILIDRIWPRGISKDAACLEEWAKDVAPTPALRIWFAHKEENCPPTLLRNALPDIATSCCRRRTSPCFMAHVLKHAIMQSFLETGF